MSATCCGRPSSSCAVLAHDCGVHVNLVADHELPVARADSIQIEQVVVNLLTNAVHAVSDLPAARRKVTVTGNSSEPGFVEIVVRDYGPGIPPDLKLFEPFVTTKEDGLGVGLAISRSIVESHGGKIWVVENEPHGSRFPFHDPAQP